MPTRRAIDTRQVKKNYLYALTCLLAVHKKRLSHPVGLLTLEIRCGQKNTTKKHPMFSANVTHTDALVWHAAKYDCAGGGLGDARGGVLGRTHLPMDVFICATHSALASSQTMYGLLKAHFYGTAFINSLATKLLINPCGTIDAITALDSR